MNDKHYVIQRRFHSGDKWETLLTKYPTPEVARQAIEQKVKGPKYRIAESYTVVRYKAIKE